MFGSKKRRSRGLKKNITGYNSLSNGPLVLAYAAMHKLSELSRYDPITLNQHLDSRDNWLLTEFLRVSPMQFVYGMASEITGMEFLAPDAF